MTWVLILNFLYMNSYDGNGAAAMAVVEFRNKKDCMDAARLWMKTVDPNPDKGIQVTAVCVPK